MAVSLAAIADKLDVLIEANWRLRKARAIRPIERELRAAMIKAFLAQGAAVLRRFRSLKDEFPETDDIAEAWTEHEWAMMLASAEIETIELFSLPLDTAVRAALTAGGKQMFARLALEGSFDIEARSAAQYLRNNGAARVTQINETTRKAMRDLVVQAADEGWSYQRTAQRIKDQFEGFAGRKPQLHIRDRAELVSVTEVGNAYSEANLIVGHELADEGYPMEKHWSTMHDGRVSEGCAANEAAGWIPLSDPFPSGHQRPLRFPGCRCDLLMRLGKEGEG